MAAREDPKPEEESMSLAIDTIHCGDCREVLKEIPDNFFDGIVTDPPYELSFMGKKWDGSGIAYDPKVWLECLRVLKPGGHLLAFGGTRTYHRMACAIEDAGFEIRDSIDWIYASGFPKSLDISKALDKMAGAEREVIGPKTRPDGKTMIEARPNGFDGSHEGYDRPWKHDREKVELQAMETAPSTDSAKQWSGFGTALKPAHEPICLARKPLSEATIAANVLKWECGGLNIDECRVSIPLSDKESYDFNNNGLSRMKRLEGEKLGQFDGGWKIDKTIRENNSGRFPANLIHDGSPEVLTEFPASSVTGNRKIKNRIQQEKVNTPFTRSQEAPEYTDSGSSARFFKSCPFTEEDIPAFVYYAKSSRGERNNGLDKTCTVKLITDNGLIDDLCLNKKDASVAAVQLLQKVTSGATVKWSIAESGESIMALCPWDSLSTTLTEINKIIESKILPSSMHSLINESIQDVNSSKEFGGNHAAIVEQLKTWILTITNDSLVLALGASRVALKMLSQTSAKESWQDFTNFHSTVKPLSLMHYLCRLITPPGGLILDPFAGSGTTCLAAKQEGFRYVGIELSSEYCEIARKRVAAVPESLDNWAK